MCRFCNKAGFGTLQPGWSRGGVQSYRESGYSGRDTDRYRINTTNTHTSTHKHVTHRVLLNPLEFVLLYEIYINRVPIE